MAATHTAKVQDSGLQYLPNAAGASGVGSSNQHLMPLTAKVSAKDHLEVGGCDVVDLVQKFGSPLYILDEATLRSACRQYREAFVRYYPGESQVLYASKAWSCLAVCAIVLHEGLGLDVVSGVKSIRLFRQGHSPTNFTSTATTNPLKNFSLRLNRAAKLLLIIGMS